MPFNSSSKVSWPHSPWMTVKFTKSPLPFFSSLTLGRVQLYFTIKKNAKLSRARQIPLEKPVSESCVLIFLLIKLISIQPSMPYQVRVHPWRSFMRYSSKASSRRFFGVGLELFTVVTALNVTVKKYSLVLFRSHGVGEFSSLWRCWCLSFSLWVTPGRVAATLISRAFHLHVLSRIIYELITCKGSKMNEWDLGNRGCYNFGHIDYTKQIGMIFVETR